MKFYQKPRNRPIGPYYTQERYQSFWDQLIGCWLFNERGGNKIHDFSLRKNHATLEDGTIGLWPGDDYDNTSAIFDAGGEDFYNLTTSHTFTVGFNLDDVTSQQYFVTKYNTNTAQRLFQYGVLSGKTLALADNQDGRVDGTATITTNTDYVVSYVYDSSDGYLRVYLDGVLDGEDSVIPTPLTDTNTDPLRLLGRKKSTSYETIANGRVKFIYCHKRALRLKEIRELHNDPYQWSKPATSRYTYFVQAAQNELIGTINSGVIVSGNLTGISNISGSISSGVSVTGNLQAVGSLSGSISSGVSVTGNLLGIGSLAGSINSGVSVSGNLTSSETGTITLTDITDNKIFQRNVLTNDRSVTISGTYTGATTSDIQYKIVNDVGGSTVVDWTILDAAPAGGTFSGSPNIPEGGKYNVHVRSRNSSQTVLDTDLGTNAWGVGQLIAILGQSNAVGWQGAGTNNAVEASASLFNNARNWGLCNDPCDDESDGTDDRVDDDVGNPGWSIGPSLVDTLIGQISIPVGICIVAHGGTPLTNVISDSNPSSYWGDDQPTNTSTLYGQFVDRIKNATTGMDSTNGVEYCVWIQGERDARKSPASDYETALETLATNINDDIGGEFQKLVVCRLGDVGGYGGEEGTDADWSTIRNAQANFTSSFAIKGPSNYGRARKDNYHYTNAGYDELGEEIARCIANDMGEIVDPFLGPTISTAQFTDTNNDTIDVTIVHNSQATDFTPTTGITGFRVLDDGVPATISSAVRQDSTTIRLTLSAAISGVGTLQYGYGLAPDTSGAVLDNSTPTLYLQPTSNDVTIQTSGLISGTINAGVIPSGNLTGISEISGSINLGIAASGNLTGIASLSGSISSGVSVSGNLQATGSLIGSISSGVTLSGNLTGIASLSGSINIGSSVSGNLTALNENELSGTISSGVSLSGSLYAIGLMTGSINLGISLSGVLIQNGIPSEDPFEIKIRDGIASLITGMTQSNGYYYNVGDINVFETSNVENWPRILISMIEEDNIDDDGFRPTNTHYTNVVKFNIRYEWENLLGVGQSDRQKIAAKMAHDLKKFFGDYYKLSDYGSYQSRLTGYKINPLNDESFPVSVDAILECEYFQQRLTPTVS